MAFQALKSAFGFGSSNKVKVSKSKSESRLEGLLRQAVVEQENGIKKSASDEREYRSIVLDNKLEAFLISDPKTETAAAALSVNVGSYSDPPELPGLAHFLEHMLFMGTEKFPNENEYSEFLSNHGGYSNAYTASELTNYHFQVISSELYNALDRFSAFFVAPLFTESGTDRELNAVDNECSGNNQNDSWRSYLIYRELANPNHPIHKFNIGNLETLKHEPLKNGVNIREELFKFYGKYYSANRMRLVVVGQENLDTLQNYVEKLFSDVKNKDLEVPYVHPDPAGLAFSKEQGNLMKYVKVVPVMDVRRIEIMWVMPPATITNKRKEAMRYIGALIGDEGEGSILSYLKKKNWANSLSAGISDANYDLSAFEVTVGCTDLGISEHQEDIIEVIYSYINMLMEKFKNPASCAYFFEEEKISSAIGFWFKNTAAPMSTAVGLAAKLQEHDLDVKDLLTNGYISTRDTFQEVVDIVGSFIPENSAVFIVWKQNESLADREETYFKTKFGLSDIPTEVVDKWKQIESYKEVGLNIPPPNKFIPSNFDILTFKKPTPAKLHEDSSAFLKDVAISTQVEVLKDLKHADIKDKKQLLNDLTTRDLTEVWDEDTFRRPIVIHSDAVSTLWFKQDVTFKRPKSMVKIFVKNPKVNESVQTQTLTSMFVSLVVEALNEETYAAQTVGFSHSIHLDDNGVMFGFSGFSETLYKYVELVANKFKELGTKGDLDSSAFDRFKEASLKALANSDKMRPISLARSAFTELSEEKHESVEVKLKVVQDLTLEDIVKNMPSFFEDVALEVFVEGNALPEDAQNVLKIATKIFVPAASVARHEFLRTSRLLPEDASSGEQLIHIESARNAENPGSAMFANFQFGEKTQEKMALLYVLSDVCHEKFFNQLRTNEQLGYIVQSGFGFSNGIMSIGFYVESNSADPVALNYRLENFLDMFEKDFVDEETFNKLVNAQINSLWVRPTNISSEVGGWYGSITSGLYGFENKMKISKALTTITLDDLKELLKTYLWKDAPKRAKYVGGVLADVHGTKLFGEEYVTKMKKGVENGVRKGFDAEFVTKWMHTKEEDYKAFCEGRGKVTILEDITSAKEKFPYYPNYAEISAKL